MVKIYQKTERAPVKASFLEKNSTLNEKSLTPNKKAIYPKFDEFNYLNVIASYSF